MPPAAGAAVAEAMAREHARRAAVLRQHEAQIAQLEARLGLGDGPEAAPEEQPAAPEEQQPGGGEYGGIGRELEQLEAESAEFADELGLLRRSVAAPAGSPERLQAQAKLAVMVRLHNETAQRHGAICASLEAKRRELEALQQHAEGGGAGAGAGAATTVLTVAAAEGAPIAANLATFGPRQVALEGAWCVQAQPLVADRPLTNGAALRGAVAVISRGVVPVVEKARRAQEAGATAVLLLNTDNKPYEPAGHGSDAGKDISIPVLTIPRDAGQALLAQLPVPAQLCRLAPDEIERRRETAAKADEKAKGGGGTWGWAAAMQQRLPSLLPEKLRTPQQDDESEGLRSELEQVTITIIHEHHQRFG